VQKLKSGTNLTNEQHIVRHIPFPNLRKDGDGKVIGILPQAFQHRIDEEYLSVNWLEYFELDKVNNLIETKKSIIEAKRSKKIAANSRLAIGNVGKIKEALLKKEIGKIRIAYAPSKANPAHSGMYHLPKEDHDLMAMLAEELFDEMHTVSAIK
jgi:hypothetical protein